MFHFIADFVSSGISWSEFPETITWMDKYRGNTCNEEVMRAMLDQVPGLIPKLGML